MWYRVALDYACFAIKEEDGKVVETAPVGKWMVGSTFDYIKSWIFFRGGVIEKMDD